MLPDNLRRLVSLDPLRPKIPAHHPPLGIEHEDRIVLNALDHQPEALFALPQRFLGLLALGEVPRDFQKSTQLAVIRPQRRNDHVCPKSRAILPQPPTFVLNAARFDCPPQFLLRPPSVKRLLRIKTRERLPNDFLSFIALEPSGTRVPALDSALGVEQENGMIL